MIHKQGLLLKFKQKFGELKEKVEIMSVIRTNVSDSRKSCSTSEDEVGQSSSPISVSEQMNRQPAMSLDVLKEQSKIYGRYKVEPKLTSWQKAVNDAAFLIAQETPDKLYNRAQLKLSAEEKARKSYVFKRKSGSRSSFEEEEDIPKREKLSSAKRENEILTCSSEIKSITAKIALQQREINKANTTKDFDLCAKLHSEQRKMMKGLRSLEKKQASLQKKQAKHERYLERKGEGKSKVSPSDSEDVFQKDIRSFMKSKDQSNDNSLLSEDKHDPQSDDTLILSSDEEKAQSLDKEEWRDIDEQLHIAERKRKMEESSEQSTKVLDDTESKCGEIKEAAFEERKRLKLGLQQQESDSESSEHGDIQSQPQSISSNESDGKHKAETEAKLDTAKEVGGIVEPLHLQPVDVESREPEKRNDVSRGSKKEGNVQNNSPFL